MRCNVQAHVNKWCLDGLIFGYPEAKNLMFVIALRTLLGMKLHPKERKEMLKDFEQVTTNLMSLPLNFPGTGLYRVRILKYLLEQKMLLFRQILVFILPVTVHNKYAIYTTRN